MAKQVTMLVALPGGEELNVGVCAAPQARILVNKGLAKWRDGKLLLAMRPSMLDHAAAVDEKTDARYNTSKRERDERIEWLKQIIAFSVSQNTASRVVNSDLDQILAAAATFRATEELAFANAVVQVLTPVSDPLDVWFEGDEGAPELPDLAWFESLARETPPQEEEREQKLFDLTRQEIKELIEQTGRSVKPVGTLASLWDEEEHLSTADLFSTYLRPNTEEGWLQELWSEGAPTRKGEWRRVMPEVGTPRDGTWETRKYPTSRAEILAGATQVIGTGSLPLPNRACVRESYADPRGPDEIVLPVTFGHPKKVTVQDIRRAWGDAPAPTSIQLPRTLLNLIDRAGFGAPHLAEEGSDRESSWASLDFGDDSVPVELSKSAENAEIVISGEGRTVTLPVRSSPYPRTQR